MQTTILTKSDEEFGRTLYEHLVAHDAATYAEEGKAALDEHGRLTMSLTLTAHFKNEESQPCCVCTGNGIIICRGGCCEEVMG